jgi:hypothetical protein
MHAHPTQETTTMTAAGAPWSLPSPPQDDAAGANPQIFFEKNRQIDDFLRNRGIGLLDRQIREANGTRRQP